MGNTANTPNGSHRNSPPGENELSDVELRIIRLICEDLTTQEIADELGVSKRKIVAYRQKLLIKTGSVNAVGIVKYAVKHGIYNL